MGIVTEKMQVPFVDLGAQYKSIEDEVNKVMMDVLQRTDFILGKDVSLLEEEFAAYCGVKYAVGVDSGTSALEMALRAYDIGPGDEVITAANTFIATALAISYTGAKVVLVDIDPDTFALDPNKLEAAITERTRAIMPVHLYGHPADMDAIMEIAKRHNLVVIEDAAQAHGAYYKGRRAGSLGHAAAFSFYPGKNMGAYGDGGMVVTDSEEVYQRLLMLRNYGQSRKYHHEMRGFNRRLDTIQAAVLRVKLKYIDQWNESRRNHASRYGELLADVPVIAPEPSDQVEPVWHLYVIRSEERDVLREYLSERGITAIMHYPVPVHLQPAYSDLGYSEGDFPITEKYAQEILSLPMYPELPEDALEYVVETIKTYAAERAL